MATLNLDENQAHYQIRAFQPGMIQINEQTFTHSVIIAPDQLIEPWPPQTTADLSVEAFATILALKPNILLIGTGSTHQLVPLGVYGHLLNAGIGVEIMSTSAACRTYNALSAENRNVVAALIV
jgi:uncharacterized protein